MASGPHKSQGRVLIVEDDENLRLPLEDNLIDEGYAVTSVANGKAALEALARGDHDVVILDIMLPDIDGYEVCRKIRERKYPVRVLMLTARTLESDLVQGFDAGADDYLSKPYRLREMLARVGALVRRGASGDDVRQEQFEFGPYRLDLVAREITQESGELNLTRTEFDLLACLLRNLGRALTREEILSEAWEPGIAIDPRTVDNFVSSLKKKLGWTRQSNYRIRTVRGVGYRMDID